MSQLQDASNSSSETIVDQCLSKERADEVFQAFETVDGSAKLTSVEPSPRLQTKLKEQVKLPHQIKVLSMMTEKERGLIEEADFPCLWEVLRDFDGNLTISALIRRKSFRLHADFTPGIVGVLQGAQFTTD
ncbi:hypothetical protein PENCOP_c002G04829 [Penicillium coprophilum]|uniref:Uncharacterized protein n=1 Tax=Penicillium coprophilum TaxID=36646 RepID=A0A1V6V2C4_9EURO|nr:hypothetical protein PENCOP_c002G04829 [Penicillium coprophilum]